MILQRWLRSRIRFWRTAEKETVSKLKMEFIFLHNGYWFSILKVSYGMKQSTAGKKTSVRMYWHNFFFNISRLSWACCHVCGVQPFSRSRHYGEHVFLMLVIGNEKITDIPGMLLSAHSCLLSGVSTQQHTFKQPRKGILGISWIFTEQVVMECNM